MFERNRIAETLRDAREKRGLTAEDAARAAGIPLQYVRLLEGESNVRVGVSDELYLIPFFRKYAASMSIDAEELLPEFLGMLQQTPSDASTPIRLAYRPRYASLWKPAAVLVTIAVAITLLLKQTRGRPRFDEQDAVDLAAAAASATVDAKPTLQATPPIAESQAAENASPSASAATAASPTPAGSVIPAPAGSHELTIVAREDAWIAMGVDDQASKQYLLRAGESRAWSGERFVLTVGNAGGIALSFDGRELSPIGRPGQVVRNLRFPEAVPPPTATPR